MNYKPYEAYRDSGIEWIGDIPEGWEVKKLKYLAHICNGQDYKQNEDIDGDYPVVGSGGAFTRTTQYLYDKPSVLLGRKGTVDKPLLVYEPFWAVDTMYYTEILSTVNVKLFYYLCLTIDFPLYSYGSTVPSMTQRDLKEVKFALPILLSEQTAIADFLDTETAKIATIIATKQKLIEKLLEKRSSIISYAVTKGLDPTATMKPSGIEWIGDIPEGWEVLSLNKLFVIKAGGDLQDHLFSKVKTDYHKYPIYTNAISEFDIYGYTEVANFNSNTITVTGRGDIGHAIYRNHPYDAIIRLLVLTPRKNYYCKYYAYFINSILDFEEGSSAINQLSTQQIAPYCVCAPQLPEQTAIADYLDTETAKIDDIIAKTKTSIDKLNEYKTALISACVTGKIDVRGAN